MKRLVAIVGGLLVVVAVAFVVRTFVAPSVGPIDASPAESSLSLDVGDTLTFQASADGAVEYSWSVWDREVSREPTWQFAPGPEEVGWQQVTLVVTGPDGTQRERSWNVGVVVPTAPELTDTAPEPGAVSTTAGAVLSFRCAARVPAARDADRVRFEWTLDGAPIRRDEQPATGGESLVSLAAPDVGVHKLAVHVREVDRIASFAEWTLEVATAPPPEPAQVARAEAPARQEPTKAAKAEEPPPKAKAEEPPPKAEEPRPNLAEAPPTTLPSPPTTLPSPPTTRPSPPSTVPSPPTTLPSPPTTIVESVPRPRPEAAATPAPPASPPTTVPVAVARLEPTEPPAPPPARLVREPKRTEVAVTTGTGLVLHVRVEPEAGPTRYRWIVDGRPVQEEREGRFDYLPIEPGRHQVSVTARAGDREVGTGSWLVVARAPVEPEPPRAPPPTDARTVATTPPPAPRPAVAARGSADLDEAPSRQLREDEVRRWLQDYAAAWSRKDVEALRRMGQVRSGSEVERLERYFKSIDDLRVEVRVVSLHVEGDRAAVEFERTDTVTDPAGQRRELRLPPIRKQIERTPQGLRFAEVGGAG